MPYDTPARALPFPYSTISRPTWGNYCVGSDWPAWQRDLHPVTYCGDEARVRDRMEVLDQEIAMTRRLVWWSLKQGEPGVTRAHRKSLDRALRFRRNCETQIRLIQNTRRIKCRAGLPPVLEVVGGTDVASQLIAAE